MLEKMKQFYQLFQEGRQVSDPSFWKKGQAYVQPIVAALIMTIVALAKGAGYDLPVSNDLAFSLAGALFFAVNSVLTIITSAHMGVKQSLPEAPVREAEPPLPSPAEADAAPAEPEAVQPDVEAAPEPQPAGDIDEATRQRAIEWVRQHSVVSQHSITNSNGLANSA